jgi:hypothetical protein
MEKLLKKIKENELSSPNSIFIPNEDLLFDEAQFAERDQQALIEASPVERTYQEELVIYVQEKYNQVEHLENQLEILIERLESKLQQSQNNAPGFLSRPGTKNAWKEQQAQQQARLINLHNRLEMVREIKEGMGAHSPKIEEMATRKMRSEHPGLAADWDEMREAGRKHLLRKSQKEKEQNNISYSLSLRLTRPA